MKAENRARILLTFAICSGEIVDALAVEIVIGRFVGRALRGTVTVVVNVAAQERA